MPTFYGVNATRVQVNQPSDKVDVTQSYGRMRVMYDEFTGAQAVYALNDNVYLMKIPKGARLIDAEFNGGDPGTTGIVTLGWLASVDRAAGAAVEAADLTGIFGAQAVKTAAVVRGKMLATATGFLKKFAAEVQAVMTFTEATDAATSIKFSLLLFVVVD